MTYILSRVMLFSGEILLLQYKVRVLKSDVNSLVRKKMRDKDTKQKKNVNSKQSSFY